MSLQSSGSLKKFVIICVQELGFKEHTRLKLSHGVVVRVVGSQRLMLKLFRRRRSDSAESTALLFSMIGDKIAARDGSTLEKFGTLCRGLGLGPGLGDLDEGAEFDCITLDPELLPLAGASKRRRL